MAEELILIHHGIKGQKWGVRRYQNRDGSLTGAGKRRYSVDEHKNVSDAPGKLVSKTGQSVELQTIPSSRITNFLSAHNRRLRTNAENTRNFKIKANGKVVGDLQLFKESKDSLNVTWVGVNESERGHGYATAAMLGSIEIARRSGCRYVTLEVPGNSPDARHVYEKLGFVAQKQISSDDDVWGGLTSMKLDLGSGEEKLKHSVLIHHGIKGQKWGVRNGPPYPLGADDKSAAEKKAASSHRLRKADTTQSDKFWTDERKTKAKQVAKGVAITAAVVLAAYGGYKLSQMPTVQEKLGRKAVGEILGLDDSIGLDALASSFGTRDRTFELTAKTARQTVIGLNPDHSKTNCGANVAAGLLNSVGYDVRAVGDIPSELAGGLGGKGLNPEKIPAVFRGATISGIRKIAEQDGVRIGGPKSAYNVMKSHLEAHGPGAAGYIFGAKKTDGSHGHYFEWVVLEDGLHILEGQPLSAQKDGIDWSGNAVYANVFRLYEPDDMYVTNNIRGGLLNGSITPDAKLLASLVKRRQ